MMDIDQKTDQKQIVMDSVVASQVHEYLPRCVDEANWSAGKKQPPKGVVEEAVELGIATNLARRRWY